MHRRSEFIHNSASSMKSSYQKESDLWAKISKLWSYPARQLELYQVEQLCWGLVGKCQTVLHISAITMKPLVG